MADTRESTISLEIPDVHLEGFESVEALSQLFEITAHVVCDDPLVDFTPKLGSPVSIEVKNNGQHVRYFHGLLFSAEFVEWAPKGPRYRLILRPWLFILSRNLDYGIHQSETALDVIKKVFSDRGCSDVDYQQLKHVDSLKKREYCVQYRESDFAFVSRLMEQEGIYYFFDHQEDKHVLTLCDDPQSHKKADYSGIEHQPSMSGRQQSDDHFWIFNEKVSTTAEGMVTLWDHDFTKPDALLKGTTSSKPFPSADKAEVFDYPADVFDFPNLESSYDNSEPHSKIILTAAQRLRSSVIAEGDTIAIYCGSTFTMSRHDIGRLEDDFLVVRLIYCMANQSYRSGATVEGGTPVYLEATPTKNPWRAPLTTPRPEARGPETAVVTVASGETVDVDKWGRVTVKFRWDRKGKNDQTSSCKLRVAYPSAGAKRGFITLPRKDEEVLVDFLNGNPDRPIIVGSVYNPKNPGELNFPDQKTRSIWATWTVGKRGTYDGAKAPDRAPDPGINAIWMEDKGGSEELVFQAQRDMAHIAMHDAKLIINRDYSRDIGRDQSTEIKRNDTTTIDDGDQTLTITKGKRTETIYDDVSLTVQKGDVSETIQKGNVSMEVDMGNVSRKVKMGDYSLKMDLGSATIEAMQQIQLKVGQSTVTLSQQGVEIKGLMITTNASVMQTLKSLMTEVDGNAMLTLKGGITMIN